MEQMGNRLPFTAESEGLECYKFLVAWTKNIIIECLHSDRGGEYLLDAFLTFLDEQGTV